MNKIQAKTFLIDNQVNFQEILSETEPKSHEVIRACFFQRQKTFIMAVLPAATVLSISELNRILESVLTYIEGDPVVPLPKAYQVEAIVDKKVLAFESVIFQSEQPGIWLKVKTDAFINLIECVQYQSFTLLPEELSEVPSVDIEEEAPIGAIHHFITRRFKQRIKETQDLPIISDVGNELLNLRSQPEPSIEDLATIIKCDPSLSAQIIRWARSPLYGFAGQIASVEDAIIRVLGYDLVMSLSIGLAIGKVCRAPESGLLSVKAVWQSALYTATLAHELSESMPLEERPEPGLLYLSGLLSNFGLLVLAHCFVSQYQLLNQMMLINPGTRLESLQYHLFGVGSEHLGYWLLKNWHLPPAILSVIRYQNEPNYQGQFAAAVHLVKIAKSCQYQMGVSFASPVTNVSDSLSFCKLTESVREQAIARILEAKEEIDAISNFIS